MVQFCRRGLALLKLALLGTLTLFKTGLPKTTLNNVTMSANSLDTSSCKELMYCVI